MPINALLNVLKALQGNEISRIWMFLPSHCLLRDTRGELISGRSGANFLSFLPFSNFEFDGSLQNRILK